MERSFSPGPDKKRPLARRPCGPDPSAGLAKEAPLDLAVDVLREQKLLVQSLISDKSINQLVNQRLKSIMIKTLSALL